MLPIVCVVSRMLTLLIDPSPYPANLLACEPTKLTEDGWIVGPKEELILWLPFGLRNRCLADFDLMNQIDFREFKCGTEWMQCRKVIDP